MAALTFADQAFLASCLSGGVTPPDFPGLLRWYKADSYVGSDGDSVGGGTNVLGEWVDQTGSGDDADNPSNGPLYKTAIVGAKPVLRFATSTGPFVNFAPGALADFTIIAANARTGTESFLVENAGNNHQIRRDLGGVSRIIWFAGGAVLFDTGLAGGASDFQITVVKRLAGVVSFRQNKTSVGGGADGNAWLINEIGFSSLGSNMDLGEMMLWNTALSDADCDQLYDEYLKPRWVTLP